MASQSHGCGDGFLTVSTAPDFFPHRETISGGKGTLLFAFMATPELEAQKLHQAFMDIMIYDGELMHADGFTITMVDPEHSETSAVDVTEFANAELTTSGGTLGFALDSTAVLEPGAEYLFEVRANVQATSETVFCTALEDGHFFTIGEESSHLIGGDIDGYGILSCVTFE